MIRWSLLAAAIGCALAPSCSLGAQAGRENPVAGAFPVVFDSEWIRLSIVGDSLEVRGTYFLYCQSRNSAPFSLFYPFPEDSLLGGARMISLRARVDRVDTGPIPWEPAHGAAGVRWLTPICSGDTIALETVYRQKLTTSYARYIVTTTKAWDRPLRLARFEIRLPRDAVPVKFSFPFVSHEDAAGRYYTFDARNFLPDRDIMVRWEKTASR